jgi:imidazoleglycerol-phosphate dehydratase / histidinol-phosphatase
MKKVLFIDRDGTVINEPADNPQIDNLSMLEFIPGVFTWLGKIAQEDNYELVMVTNQDGLGTSIFPEETFWPVQNLVIKTLEGEGIRFDTVHIDRSMPEEKKPTRKPGTAMLQSYFSNEYDLANSYVIGDRLTDIELAKNLGCQGILINNGSLKEKLDASNYKNSCSLITTSWNGYFYSIKFRWHRPI